MDGLVTRVEGRPVIVLHKEQELSDWMLFILAHEDGHVGRGHLSDEEGAAVVDDNISDVTYSRGVLSDEEIEANEYARDVLVDQGGQIAIDDRIPNADLFAKDAVQFGRQHGIGPGHVVRGDRNILINLGGDHRMTACARAVSLANGMKQGGTHGGPGR